MTSRTPTSSSRSVASTLLRWTSAAVTPSTMKTAWSWTRKSVTPLSDGTTKHYLTNIAYINRFKDYERLCGLNIGISGIFGAFITLILLNWNETSLLFGGGCGRILTLDILIFAYLFYSFFISFSQINGRYLIQFIGAIFGGLIFATIAKPIRFKPWKLIARIFSGCCLLGITVGCLVSFILKNINS